jgi:uncharacterized membrane protein
MRVNLTHSLRLSLVSAAVGLAILVATGGVEKAPGGVASAPPFRAAVFLLSSLLAVVILGWLAAPGRGPGFIAKTIAIPLVLAQALVVVWTAGAFVGNGAGNFFAQWLFLVLTANGWAMILTWGATISAHRRRLHEEQHSTGD